MWPPPDDQRIVERMRTAHRRARAALDTPLEPDAAEAWGWRGRTLGRPVRASDRPAWLRLACAPVDHAEALFWDGALQAEQAVPASVPRPRLRRVRDWTDGPWRYRAELHDRAAHTVATCPIPVREPDLPASWWTAVHAALDDLATVPTDRVTIDQTYLDQTMPQVLGVPPGTTPPSWSTAHGDFHFTNLCAPTLCVLDWEGWGLAPTGYDAATLSTHSALVPSLAARIRAELAHLLDTPAGRFAELVVIAELLQSPAHRDNRELTEVLHRRAVDLVGGVLSGSLPW